MNGMLGIAEVILAFERPATTKQIINLSFSIGLELRNANTIPNGDGIESSSLFIGPNLSYRTDSWYFAITYLPQLPAIKRSENLPNSSLVLDEHERNNLRLILGFSI